MKAMIVPFFGFPPFLLLVQNYEAYDKTNFYELTSPVFVRENVDGSLPLLVDEGGKFTLVGKKGSDFLIFLAPMI